MMLLKREFIISTLISLLTQHVRTVATLRHAMLGNSITPVIGLCRHLVISSPVTTHIIVITGNFQALEVLLLRFQLLLLFSLPRLNPCSFHV